MAHGIATFFYGLFATVWFVGACATIWLFVKSWILLDQMDDKS